VANWLYTVLSDSIIWGAIVGGLISLALSFLFALGVGHYADSKRPRPEKLFDNLRQAALNFCFVCFASASALTIFELQRLQQEHALRVQELRRFASILDMSLFDQMRAVDLLKDVDSKILEKAKSIYDKAVARGKQSLDEDFSSPKFSAKEWLSNSNYFNELAASVAKLFNVELLRSQGVETLALLNAPTRRTFFSAQEVVVTTSASIVSLDAAIQAYTRAFDRVDPAKYESTDKIYNDITHSSVDTLRNNVAVFLAYECILKSTVEDEANAMSINSGLGAFELPKLESNTLFWKERFSMRDFLNKNKDALEHYRVDPKQTCFASLAQLPGF
jgi:hypothetical protein